MKLVSLALWRIYRSLHNLLNKLSGAERLRYRIICLLGLTVTALIYFGTTKFLKFLDTQIVFGYLTPSVFLALILSTISLFVYFSSLSHMTGLLTQGGDSDFLYAFPISPTGLLALRLTETAVYAGWMSFVLSLSLLAAIGSHVGVQLFYYLPLGAVLVAVFLLSISALGVSSAVVLVRLFPPAFIERQLALGIFLILGGAGVLFLSTYGANNPVVKLLHVISSNLLPSTWVGTTLGELALGSPLSPEAYCAWFFFTVFAISSAVFLSEVSLRSAASRALERAGRIMRHRFLVALTAPLADPARGIILREMAFLLRNSSTLVHLLFLTSLALAYGGLVSHSKLDELVVPGDPRIWEMFYLGTNMAVGGFIATAFLARLALPMTSLEGQAVWLSLCSPCPPQQVLALRRVLWCFPTWFLTVGIGGIGTLFIVQDPIVRIVALGLSILLGWCLTSIALTSGARFARFEWSHPGELIASFGSMVFMTSSVLVTSALSTSFATVAVLQTAVSKGVFCALLIAAALFSEYLFRGGGNAILKAAS